MSISMNISMMKQHPGLTVLLQALRRYQLAGLLFWEARSSQERRLLSLGGAVAALALAYALLLAPALSHRAQLKKDLPLLHQQVAELQALAREAASLAAQTRIEVPAMGRDSLTHSLAAHGLSAQSLSLTGEYAKLKLVDVPFSSVISWLDALRRESRIAVQDAAIVAQGKPGMVEATLTLHQNAGLVK